MIVVQRLSGKLPGGLRLANKPDELWGVESLTQVSAGTLYEWMIELGKVPPEAQGLLTYTSRLGTWLGVHGVTDGNDG